jgi:hypothetical protein
LPNPNNYPQYPSHPVFIALPALQAHSFDYRSELPIYSSSASPTLPRSYLYPVHIFTSRNQKKLRLKAESEAFLTNKAHSICAILGGKERPLHHPPPRYYWRTCIELDLLYNSPSSSCHFCHSCLFALLCLFCRVTHIPPSLRSHQVTRLAEDCRYDARLELRHNSEPIWIVEDYIRSTSFMFQSPRQIDVQKYDSLTAIWIQLSSPRLKLLKPCLCLHHPLTRPRRHYLSSLSVILLDLVAAHLQLPRLLL